MASQRWHYYSFYLFYCIINQGGNNIRNTLDCIKVIGKYSTQSHLHFERTIPIQVNHMQCNGFSKMNIYYYFLVYYIINQGGNMLKKILQCTKNIFLDSICTGDYLNLFLAPLPKHIQCNVFSNMTQFFVLNCVLHHKPRGTC